MSVRGDLGYGREHRDVLLDRELERNNPQSIAALRADDARHQWLRDIAESREVLAQLRAQADLVAEGLPSSDPEHARQLARAKRTYTHFPVLAISAPHIDREQVTHFPGEPTPLLYAIAPAQQASRLGLMSSARLPSIEVMHHHVFDESFKARLCAILERDRPWVVGISNMAEGHHNALELARMVKQRVPESAIVIGGSHEDGTNPEGFERDARSRGGTLRPEARARIERLRTLGIAADREVIDFVVCGDGSYILLELLCIAGDMPGPDPVRLRAEVTRRVASLAGTRGSGELYYVDPTSGALAGVSFCGPPVDREALPFIDRRFAAHNRYACFGGRPTAQIMWNDGCVEVCSFCHEAKEHLLYGVKKVRQRSPRNVLDELERIVALHGIEKFFFDDSTFTQYRTPTRTLLRGLIDRRARLGAGFEWGCQTTIARVDAPLLERMAAAGCCYIYFGLEGAAPDPALTTKVRKLARERRSLPVLEDAAAERAAAEGGWLARFLDVADWCDHCGIRVGASLQFGLGERDDDILRLFGHLRRLHERGTIPAECVALNMNAIYPGTEQYRLEVIEGGADVDYRRRLTRHPGFETQHDLCPQPRARAEWIYARAAAMLGRALVGSG